MFFYADNMMNFAFAESLDDDDYIPGGYGLFGVPFDSTTSYMAGSRYGPKAIREASYNFESYNMRFNKDVSAVCYDIGDVQVNNGNYMATNMMIKDTVKSLLEMDLKPIAMGGEHTITNGVLGGIYEYDEDLYHDMSIIHFDAHFDMRDEYMGEKFSHAAVLRRLHELKPKDITQLGIRSAEYDEFEYVKSHDNINYFTSYDIKDNIQNVLNYLEDLENPLYISVDIDVLDPAYAPSVGTPASCGITPFELEDMMAIICKKDVIGLDVVEVSSNTIGDPTSVNAAKVIYDFLTHKS
ncbi:agmatinase [Methanosphaera cuniculi]|uniref:Agmatinase n=1 Tax=Methanosphaera cuniculi TaxID=1077256 RepID=A0A2A2HEJ7_9EURY|nr:agmatinase [Methanosphaera cuniculi]PAV07891.1 hypothetical protein ASJ82_06795 [Methanosphaera cuniculi]PWL07709.1 agmatinase [Methanosphaera cuniculi]